jgi:formamidopyrimidine-DNA glycosylase
MYLIANILKFNIYIANHFFIDCKIIIYVINSPYIPKIPELIETAMIAQDLKYLVGKEIKSFTYQHNKLLNADKLVCPAKIIEITTHGKKILIKLDNNLIFLVSLGMTGKFTYIYDKHCHITFQFDDLTLYYHDARRFGKIDVVNMNQLPKYFTSLGVNMINHLDNWVSLKDWLKIFNPKVMKKRKICDILIDQTLISGAGMYIMTDTLYLAGVNPLRLAYTITKEELDLIRIATHEIINLSFQSGGHTFSDFERPDGTKGGYKPLIYGRVKDDIGFKVINHKINKNKSVHYVREVQI